MELWYDGRRIRGLKSVAYILLGYIFDNREMADGEKLDIPKVSKDPENLTLVLPFLYQRGRFLDRILSEKYSRLALEIEGNTGMSVISKGIGRGGTEPKKIVVEKWCYFRRLYF